MESRELIREYIGALDKFKSSGQMKFPRVLGWGVGLGQGAGEEVEGAKS